MSTTISGKGDSRPDVAGMMLVSRAGGMLYRTVPALLGWCDRVLLVKDNEDSATRAAIHSLRERYGGRIGVAESGYPPLPPSAEAESPHNVFRRFRALQGEIREAAIRAMREWRPPEILVWPDSDEVFSDHFRVVLDEFSRSDRGCVLTLPVDVYGDMRTIRKRSMSWHIRVMRFLPELTALPWRGKCRYHPFERGDNLQYKYVVVHLANLTPEIRDWRRDHWSRECNKYGDGPLWRLDRDVTEMQPDEIMEVLRSPPHLTVSQYENN